jgi:hypothetical protein
MPGRARRQMRLPRGEEFLDEIGMLCDEPIAEAQAKAASQRLFDILGFQLRAHLRRRLRRHEHGIFPPNTYSV